MYAYSELDDGPWLGAGAGDCGVALSVDAEHVLDFDRQLEIVERGREAG